MISQDKCEGCGVIAGGPLFREILSEYREHEVCDWCTLRWQRYELRLGRLIEFEEFKKGLKPESKLSTPSARAKYRRNKEIKERLGKGESIADLAKTFGVSQRTIQRAVQSDERGVLSEVYQMW